MLQETANPQTSAGAPQRGLGGHALRTLALALPVMAARFGLMLQLAVDSVMTGQAGAAELAHYGISVAPHMFVLVVGIGLMVGTVVLVGQAEGAGRSGDCGAIWHSALAVAAAFGVAGTGLMLFGEQILLLLGQSGEMAAGGGRALAMLGLGLPAFLMFVATGFLLEGLGRPRAVMLVSLAGNLPNAGLNWLLIEGQLGAPAQQLRLLAPQRGDRGGLQHPGRTRPAAGGRQRVQLPEPRFGLAARLAGGDQRTVDLGDPLVAEAVGAALDQAGGQAIVRHGGVGRLHPPAQLRHPGIEPIGGGLHLLAPAGGAARQVDLGDGVGDARGQHRIATLDGDLDHARAAQDMRRHARPQLGNGAGALPGQPQLMRIRQRRQPEPHQQAVRRPQAGVELRLEQQLGALDHGLQQAARAHHLDLAG